MQNISVYFNQLASQTDLSFKDEINQSLFRSHLLFKNPENLDQLNFELKEDIKNNVDAVLSIGGDGTVHSIIQKLAGTDIGLFVLPGGTANDLAKHIGSTKNAKKMAQTIRNNLRKKIDLISINGVFMSTNGGLGLASEVAIEVNKTRKEYPRFKDFMRMSGKSIYPLILSKNLLLKDIRSYDFQIESKEFSGRVTTPLILINNQPVLGGSFEVAPYTKHDDGTFNMTIFTHSNRLELISALTKLLAKQDLSSDKNIIHFETSEINITHLAKEKLTFFGDGETFAHSNEWNIKLYPKFLTIFSPNDIDEFTNISTQISLLN